MKKGFFLDVPEVKGETRPFATMTKEDLTKVHDDMKAHGQTTLLDVIE